MRCTDMITLATEKRDAITNREFAEDDVGVIAIRPLTLTFPLLVLTGPAPVFPRYDYGPDFYST